MAAVMKSSVFFQRLSTDGNVVLKRVIRSICCFGAGVLLAGTVAAAENGECHNIEIRDSYHDGDTVEVPERSVLYGSLEKNPDKLDLILKTLEKQCKDSDAEACLRLGDVNYFEELARVLITEDLCDMTFVALDRKLKKRSAKYYDLACELGKAQGCGNAAMVIEEFLSDEKEMARVIDLYKRGCDDGDGRSCSRLAMIYYTGYGTESNHRKAYEYLKKAHEYPFVDTYDLAGLLYLNGEFLGRDFKLAFENFKKGCELGSGFSCGQLGAMYHGGLSVEKNRDTALNYFSRGCNLDDGSSCFYAGLHYLNRNNTESDYVHAVDYFEDGCDLDEASSCFYLGYMNKHGLGTPEDYRQALIYLKRGCSYRDSVSCRKVDMHADYLLSAAKNNVKRAEIQLDNVDFDKKLDGSVKEMLEIIDGQCRTDNAESCTFLGEFYSESQKDMGDDDKRFKVVTYLKKACDLKNADGCYDLGMIYYDLFVKSHSKADLVASNDFLKAANEYFPSMRNSSMYNRTSSILNYFDSTPAGLKKVSKKHQTSRHRSR